MTSEKDGEWYVRFKARGRSRAARQTAAADGSQRVLVESGTYTARYRDADGRTVERPTGWSDEANARRRLTKWEREVERVRAGVLSPADVSLSRHVQEPIDSHFAAFETRQQRPAAGGRGRPGRG